MVGDGTYYYVFNCHILLGFGPAFWGDSTVAEGSA